MNKLVDKLYYTMAGIKAAVSNNFKAILNFYPRIDRFMADMFFTLIIAFKIVYKLCTCIDNYS